MKNLQACFDAVTTYDEALDLALRMINEDRGDKEVVFVSHPMSPTAAKTITEHLDALRIVIDHYNTLGYYVFDQIPFMNIHLKNLVEHDEEEKFKKFFTPLLMSGKFDMIVFAKNWRKSPGCQKEFMIVQDFDMKKIFL